MRLQDIVDANAIVRQAVHDELDARAAVPSWRAGYSEAIADAVLRALEPHICSYADGAYDAGWRDASDRIASDLEAGPWSTLARDEAVELARNNRIRRTDGTES